MILNIDVNKLRETGRQKCALQVPGTRRRSTGEMNVDTDKGNEVDRSLDCGGL